MEKLYYPQDLSSPQIARPWMRTSCAVENNAALAEETLLIVLMSLVWQCSYPLRVKVAALKSNTILNYT